MDLFDDVALFRSFIPTKKSKPHRSIYHAEFSKDAKFHKNPLQTHGIMGAKLAKFLKEMYARGQRLPPGIHFFVKIGRFGGCHFHEFTTDSYLQQFGMIN